MSKIRNIQLVAHLTWCIVCNLECVFSHSNHKICKYTCKQQQTRTYHNDLGELPKEMGRCVVFPHNQEVWILPAQKLYANINRANTQCMCYY